MNYKDIDISKVSGGWWQIMAGKGFVFILSTANSNKPLFIKYINKMSIILSNKLGRKIVPAWRFYGAEYLDKYTALYFYKNRRDGKNNKFWFIYDGKSIEEIVFDNESVLSFK